MIGYQTPKLYADRQIVRRVVRRENKCVLSLPIILSYNMRSIWSKLDMHERSADLSFLCEVWEKSESKKHQRKVEEMLEMGGIPANFLFQS